MREKDLFQPQNDIGRGTIVQEDDTGRHPSLPKYAQRISTRIATQGPRSSKLSVHNLDCISYKTELERNTSRQNSLASLEPLREMTAMSEEGSRSGSTRSACLVKRTRPSRKGGIVSCTISTVRTSLSASKSRSFCNDKSRGVGLR